MAENTTGLSFVGIIKWIMVVASLPCLIKAWQGIIVRVTATGYGPRDVNHSQLLTGWDAVKYGWLNLLYAVLLITGAWALWYFWQQYED